MKFSALLVAVSLIASSAALAVPEDALVARNGFQGGFRNGQGKAGNQGGNAAAAAAKASQAAAAAKASQAAAAAKASQAAAAKGSQGGNKAASSGNNAASSGSNAAASSGNLQTSLTLDSSVIQTVGTGQNPPVAGQSNAAVSTNNFINFCAPGVAKGVPITNGLQTTTGSCNPTPIGNIPSTANMPSSKFQSPTNGDTIAANTAFVVTLGVKNIQLGTFTNAAQTYFANPQTLNGAGQIIGHTHIVMEKIDSLASTTITNPNQFQFFKGIDNGQDGNGNVQVNVTAGLPAGFYRFGTIMSSATHQPVIVPIAQHGLVDDVIYVTVSANGAASTGNNAGSGAAAGSTGSTGANKGATGGNTGSTGANKGATGGKTGSTGATKGATGGNKGATGANKGASKGANKGAAKGRQ